MKSHDESFYVALGQRITELREARGLTQQQLGEQLGIAQQTIGHYEVGRARIQVATLPALADALDVSLNALLGPLRRVARKRQPPRRARGES